MTFLDETFSASTAPPEHRLHQRAAQSVLKALLPESGTDIKGQMRSESELRSVSGYASQPRDFDDVIRILDSELRLITPTDPETSVGEGRPDAVGRERYYQLTHDYLVHFAARLADAQAARNAPRARRAAAGRTRGDLGSQAGDPPPAEPFRVGQNPHALPAQGLDRAAKANDAPRRPGPWSALARDDRCRGCLGRVRARTSGGNRAS